MLVAVGTFLSIGLKLAYFTFFHGEFPSEKVHPLPGNCYLAMALTAGSCFLFGIAPSSLYHLLPYAVHYEIFTLGHVLQTLQMLAGTCLGFAIIRSFLHTDDIITIDIDWTYRLGAHLFMKGICTPMRQGQEAIQDGWSQLIPRVNKTFQSLIPAQKMTAVGFPLLWISCACLFASLLIILLS